MSYLIQDVCAERRWITRSIGSQLVSGTMNDAGTTTVPWLTVTRSGVAPVLANISTPARIGNFSAGSLPPADLGPGTLIYVYDAIPTACLAYSDGAAWKKVNDNSHL